MEKFFLHGVYFLIWLIYKTNIKKTDNILLSVLKKYLFRSYFENKDIADLPIKEVMGKPFPVVLASASIDEVSKLINKDNQAVLVDLGNGKHHIITKHDIISSIK